MGFHSKPNPGPVDHWAAHVQQDVVALAKAGYEVESVAGDGNCLFRAMLASKFSELAQMCISCRMICVTVVCVCVCACVCGCVSACQDWLSSGG